MYALRVMYDEDTAELLNESLHGLLQGYEPINTCNGDRTGLFYNLQPSKTFSMKGEPYHGNPKKENCPTMMLCCNSNSSDKLK